MRGREGDGWDGWHVEGEWMIGGVKNISGAESFQRVELYRGVGSLQLHEYPSNSCVISGSGCFTATRVSV